MTSFGRVIENVQYLDIVRRFQRNPPALQIQASYFAVSRSERARLSA